MAINYDSACLLVVQVELMTLWRLAGCGGGRFIFDLFKKYRQPHVSFNMFVYIYDVHLFRIHFAPVNFTASLAAK